MNKLVFVAIAAAIGLVSCEKKDQIEAQSASNDISNQIILEDLDVITGSIITKAPIIIAQWDEWGRAAKNCDGMGLCNVEWFPQFNNVAPPPPPNGGQTVIEFDQATSMYYMDILFSSSMGSTIPSQLNTLPVDLDIPLVGIEQQIGQPLTIPAGQYPYDPNLGSNGGYRITLQ